MKAVKTYLRAATLGHSKSKTRSLLQALTMELWALGMILRKQARRISVDKSSKSQTISFTEKTWAEFTMTLMLGLKRSPSTYTVAIWWAVTWTLFNRTPTLEHRVWFTTWDSKSTTMNICPIRMRARPSLKALILSMTQAMICCHPSATMLILILPLHIVKEASSSHFERLRFHLQ